MGDGSTSRYRQTQVIDLVLARCLTQFRGNLGTHGAGFDQDRLRRDGVEQPFGEQEIAYRLVIRHGGEDHGLSVNGFDRRRSNSEALLTRSRHSIGADVKRRETIASASDQSRNRQAHLADANPRNVIGLRYHL